MSQEVLEVVTGGVQSDSQLVTPGITDTRLTWSRIVKPRLKSYQSGTKFFPGGQAAAYHDANDDICMYLLREVAELCRAPYWEFIMSSRGSHQRLDTNLKTWPTNSCQSTCRNVWCASIGIFKWFEGLRAAVGQQTCQTRPTNGPNLPADAATELL